MTNHTSLMKILVKLTTSEYGSIETLQSLKKLTWISISVRKFQEPDGDEAKARAKRIIAYYIKDHLIPHRHQKEVFDAMTKQSKKKKRLL